MMIKTLIGAVSLLALGIGPCDADIVLSGGICSSYMTCLKPLLNNVLTYRNAMDMFEFDNLIKTSWMKMACDLHLKLLACYNELKTSSNAACLFASTTRTMKLNQELMKMICEHQSVLMAGATCWGNQNFKNALRMCYTTSIMETVECQSKQPAKFTDCNIPAVHAIVNATLKLYLPYVQ